MKLGIMQPYFFPYLGYWQLLNIVDKYVIYDDVNYIKGGWINRNRILSNGGSVYFNLPIIGASSNKRINEIKVNLNQKAFDKCMKTIIGCYSKAPYFNEVLPLIREIMSYSEDNLALFLKHSIELIAEYLRIDTIIILSSEIEKNTDLKGQDKVLSICNTLNANEYYNAIGGKNLYSYQDFANKNIELKFIDCRSTSYKQFKNDFVPYLSIIDVLMFNSKDKILELLEDCKIICEDHKI